MDLRNIEEADLDLARGLNVFVGRNAQGKTSVLEGVGLALPRPLLPERGRARRRPPRAAQASSPAAARQPGSGRETALELRDRRRGPALPRGRTRRAAPRVPGPAGGGGLLHRAPARGARSHARAAAVPGPRSGRALALLPAAPPRVRARARPAQRRPRRARPRPRRPGTSASSIVGGALRHRRAEYAQRLTRRPRARLPARGRGLRGAGSPAEPPDEARPGPSCAGPRTTGRAAELGAGRSLVGPHRDAVSLLLNGEEAADAASAGQARSLLLALALATLEIYPRRAGRGGGGAARRPRLGARRGARRCCSAGRWRRAGQALVTTAHPAWAAEAPGGGAHLPRRGGRGARRLKRRACRTQR